MQNNSMFGGPLVASIMAVRPEEYIEPNKGKGTFELTGHLMNAFEKGAYTVYRQLIEQVNQLNAASKGELSMDKKGKLMARADELEGKAGAAKSMMSVSISDRLNLWNRDVSVSQGWKIIFPDSEAEMAEAPQAVITIGIPPQLRALLEVIRRKVADGAEDNAGTLSEMARNIMRYEKRL